MNNVLLTLVKIPLNNNKFCTRNFVFLEYLLIKSSKFAYPLEALAQIEVFEVFRYQQWFTVLNSISNEKSLSQVNSGRIAQNKIFIFPEVGDQVTFFKKFPLSRSFCRYSDLGLLLWINHWWNNICWSYKYFVFLQNSLQPSILNVACVNGWTYV